MIRRDDFQREVLERLRAMGGDEDRFAEQAGRPLSEAIDGFLHDVRHGTATTRTKGAPCVTHVRRVARTIREMVAANGWQTVGELTGKAALHWLLAQKWAASTRGIAKVLVRMFGSWLVREGWLASNPFELLVAVPSQGEPRTVRGVLRPQDIASVIGVRHATARAEAKALMLAAHEFEVACLLGAFCGLRLNEVLTLRVGDLALDGDEPAIRLRASVTKNRKAARIELPAHVASAVERQTARLRRVLGRDLEPSERVLPSLTKRLTRIMQADLITAGVAVRRDGYAVNQRGEVLGFHSLRCSFASWLIAAGVSPIVAQRLLRHADVRLTLTSYARIPDGALRAAADALPPLPRYLPAASVRPTARRDAIDS